MEEDFCVGVGVNLWGGVGEIGGIDSWLFEGGVGDCGYYGENEYGENLVEMMEEG